MTVMVVVVTIIWQPVTACYKVNVAVSNGKAAIF